MNESVSTRKERNEMPFSEKKSLNHGRVHRVGRWGLSGCCGCGGVRRGSWETHLSVWRTGIKLLLSKLS